jgi:hypothetical protein
MLVCRSRGLYERKIFFSKITLKTKIAIKVVRFEKIIKIEFFDPLIHPVVFLTFAVSPFFFLCLPIDSAPSGLAHHPPVTHG